MVTVTPAEVGECLVRYFHAEASLVRPQFVSGTHALATVLLALLNPGDTMVSAVGSPYDTMQSVIGITGDTGNLKSAVSGIKVPLKGNAYDLDAIAAAVDENVKLVEIQRPVVTCFAIPYFLRDIKNCRYGQSKILIRFVL